MLSLKALKPSKREKKRYLVYQVEGKAKQDQIVSELKNKLGLFGTAKAGILPIEFKNNKGIIRINHKMVDEVRSLFLFISEINKQKVVIKTLGVSGILKKAKEKYLQG